MVLYELCITHCTCTAPFTNNGGNNDDNDNNDYSLYLYGAITNNGGNNDDNNNDDYSLYLYGAWLLDRPSLRVVVGPRPPLCTQLHTDARAGTHWVGTRRIRGRR